MSLHTKFQEQFRPVHQVLWILLIPISLDLASYLLFERIFRTIYQPAPKFFTLKVGFFSAPPSIRFIFDDFPSLLFQSTNGSLQGIIYRLTPFNILLLLSLTLILSFLHSTYLCVLAASGHRPLGLKACLGLGNRFWFRFFILQILVSLPFVLMLVNPGLIYLSLLNLLLVYVQYAIVVDEGTLRDNFQQGIGFLRQNIGLTLKMALYFGLIISLLGVILNLSGSLGRTGMILAIFLVAYLGAVINKTVLEVYREKGPAGEAKREATEEDEQHFEVYG
jgi:hypothetical protein